MHWIFTPLALSAQNLLPFRISEHWHFPGALGSIGAAFSPFALFFLSLFILRIFGNTWPDFGKLALGKYATLARIGGSLLSAMPASLDAARPAPLSVRNRIKLRIKEKYKYFDKLSTPQLFLSLQFGSTRTVTIHKCCRQGLSKIGSENERARVHARQRKIWKYILMNY